MKRLNSVTMEGKVVSDIVLRQSKKGIPVIDFRLMQKQANAPNALFIDVEVWGKEAERVAENAKRGNVVVIHAELRQDVWMKEGQKRSKHKLTAEKVIINTSVDIPVSNESGKF